MFSTAPGAALTISANRSVGNGASPPTADAYFDEAVAPAFFRFVVLTENVAPALMKNGRAARRVRRQSEPCW